MTIEYQKGDLFLTSDRCFVHGCNSRGVMGSGVAKIVKEKYPQAFQDYEDFCFDTALDSRLGKIVVSYSNGKIIVNAITQAKYGRDGAKYVSYDAIHDCFTAIREDTRIPERISIPKIGAGLGGGDWTVIASIIAERCNGYKHITVWEPEEAAMPYDSETSEHIRKAMFWKGREGQYGTLYITQRGSTDPTYSLDIRTFSGPEVEWRHCFDVSKKEALEIKERGLADAWMGCLGK